MFCLFTYRKPPGHPIDLTKIQPPNDILSLKQAQRTRNSAHRRLSKKKTTRGQESQTTGEDKTNNQRVALIQLHTIKSLNNKTIYLSILMLSVNELNSRIERHHLANWIKKEDPTICCLQETHLIDRNIQWLRVKGWKKIYQASGPQKQAGEAIHIRQSRLQMYIGQMRQRNTLHTNKRGNTSKGNNNYQPI
jgi:hypothetical protein